MIYLKENLSYLRDKHQLPIKKVAESINSKTSTVGHWETGFSSPRLDDLIKLAALYKVSIHDLSFFDLQNPETMVTEPHAVPVFEDELFAAYIAAPQQVKNKINKLLGFGGDA